MVNVILLGSFALLSESSLYIDFNMNQIGFLEEFLTSFLSRIFSTCQSVNGDNDDDDSTDDDDESSNMMVDTPESNSQSNSVNVQASEVRPSVAAEAEDGWTVVSSKRKGKRN